ncbi:arsenosugar biosynthesis radical SAM (seleno)protein ArsS [Candidatus Altiarchaeota archaeon]
MFPNIRRDGLEILQVNLGLVCNQQCRHCHHSAGPDRREMMGEDTVEHIISFLKENDVKTLDVTGGAPELNPYFRKLVESALPLVTNLIVRSNLTAMTVSGQEDTPEFLAECKVHLVCSLPCYLEENVDAQRGCGVYEKSIDVLKRLNQIGYGRDDELVLDLVYNPQGAFLPGCQKELETAYKENLSRMHGISFNNLLTITNMPLGRFRMELAQEDGINGYDSLMEESRNNSLAGQVMCKRLVSVGWDGIIYDCDFNLALDMPSMIGGRKISIKEAGRTDFRNSNIVTGDQCIGCIAGAGSSCFGSLDR